MRPGAPVGTLPPPADLEEDWSDLNVSEAPGPVASKAITAATPAGSPPVEIGLAEPAARPEGRAEPVDEEPAIELADLDAVEEFELVPTAGQGEGAPRLDPSAQDFLAPPAPAAAGAPASAVAQSADGGEAALREALSRASREVIERIAWEIVPPLAETIIREHIDRLVKERQG